MFHLNAGSNKHYKRIFNSARLIILHSQHISTRDAVLWERGWSMPPSSPCPQGVMFEGTCMGTTPPPTSPPQQPPSLPPSLPPLPEEGSGHCCGAILAGQDTQCRWKYVGGCRWKRVSRSLWLDPGAPKPPPCVCHAGPQSILSQKDPPGPSSPTLK